MKLQKVRAGKADRFELSQQSYSAIITLKNHTNMKILLFLLVPFLSFGQGFYGLNNDPASGNTVMVGCVDLDETIIDLVSVFGDASLLGDLLGCAEIIPTLESGILSAFLPFDIPLDCSTDLTPFGYLDMNLSNVCECSCQKYLDLSQESLSNRKTIKIVSLLGLETTAKGLHLQIYDDGSIEKKYLIK